MTDQKSDQPGGDGLLACPFCGFAPKCNGHPAGIMGQIYCANADCFGPRTTAGHKADSIKQWNTRVPTRDGAEGAEQNEIHSSGSGVESKTRKELSSGPQSLIAAGNVDSLGVAPGLPDFNSAPPKPDATREALAEIVALNITPDTGATTAMLMRRIASEALSVPVPPASYVDPDMDQAANRRYWEGRQSVPPADDGALDLPPTKSRSTPSEVVGANHVGPEREEEIRPSIPSTTGAAEPDFETAALALGFRKRQQDGKWWHPNQQHFVKHHDTAGDIFDWYFGKGWGERAAEPWPPYIELPLTFWYKNHRGEESLRTAFPISIRFGTTEWHPEAQWLLKAFDRDKQVEREFAMRDMLATPPVRGDRGAIARIIAPEAFAADYQHYFPDRSTLEQFEAYKKADAILSLPVQPGAGERDSDAAEADRYFEMASEFGNQLHTLAGVVQDAVDIFAERKHGSDARSPGHNARVILETALKKVSPSALPIRQATPSSSEK